MARPRTGMNDESRTKSEEVAAAILSQSHGATKKRKRTVNHGPRPLRHSIINSFAANEFYANEFHLTCRPDSATIAALICAPRSGCAGAAATARRITKMRCYTQYGYATRSTVFCGVAGMRSHSNGAEPRQEGSKRMPQPWHAEYNKKDA